MRKRWGWMLTLLKGKHFKVKLLYFEQGGSISMQRHQHRRELWLFIFGTGTMLRLDGRNNEIEIKGKLDGGYLEVDHTMWHQYKAKKPTLVLEVQYGHKCSERDIERA